VKINFRVKDGAEGKGDIWVFNTSDALEESDVNTGSVSIMTDGIRRLGDVPNTFSLEQNYPNPFNMDTEIIYQLPEADYVEITIYNSLGNEIRRLVSRNHDAGRYAARWNGLDSQGNSVTSGIYMYRFKTSKFDDSKKMLLLK